MSYNAVESNTIPGATSIIALSRGTLARSPLGRLFIRTQDGIVFLSDGSSNSLNVIGNKPCLPLAEGEQISLTIKRRYIKPEQDKVGLNEAGDGLGWGASRL